MRLNLLLYLCDFMPGHHHENYEVNLKFRIRHFEYNQYDITYQHLNYHTIFGLGYYNDGQYFCVLFRKKWIFDLNHKNYLPLIIPSLIINCNDGYESSQD